MLFYDYSDCTENDLTNWLFLNPKAIEIHRLNAKKVIIFDQNLEIQKVYFLF